MAGRGDECRWFQKGEQLFIAQTAFSDATCMRPRGEIDCYWINRGYME
jgi:hypothetical protein